MPNLEDVEKSVDFFVKYGKGFTSFIEADFQKFAIKYNFALNDYYTAKIKSLSKIKLPLFSSEVINLEEVYIPQSIEHRYDKINQDKILVLDNEKNKLLITGTAGAGKSCLMRSLFLDILKGASKLFPIFLELRKVNDIQESIIETLVRDIAQFNDKFCTENLEFIFKREGTILFLDGFDEINHENKKRYIAEINLIAEKYPSLKILISSRPEEGAFVEWSLFDVFQISKLSLQQSKKLVLKLPVDRDLKDRFIAKLDFELYNQHQDFASNPLLLSILLLTFEEFAEIPDKLHIFYDIAYQTLFNRHDSYKQGYKRKSLTNLDIQEFKKAFSLFSLITYCKEKFVFKADEIIQILAISLDKLNFSTVNSEDFKTELMTNVPLIAQDGFEYSFTHRSFQEYFTAYCIINNPDISEIIINKVFLRFKTDNVINMAFSMNQQILEDKWILPKINGILDKYYDNGTANNKIEMLSLFYTDMQIMLNEDEMEEEIVYTFGVNRYFIGFLQEKYNLVEEYRKIFDSNPIVNNKNAETQFMELVLRNDRNKSVNIKGLNDFEKNLFCQLEDYKLAEMEIAFLKFVKHKISTDRKENLMDIAKLIFNH